MKANGGERWTRVGIALAVAFLGCLGAYLRFKRLGHMSLVADEGFTVLAVRGILEDMRTSYPRRTIHAGPDRWGALEMG